MEPLRQGRKWIHRGHRTGRILAGIRLQCERIWRESWGEHGMEECWHWIGLDWVKQMSRKASELIVARWHVFDLPSFRSQHHFGPNSGNPVAAKVILNLLSHSTDTHRCHPGGAEGLLHGGVRWQPGWQNWYPRGERDWAEKKGIGPRGSEWEEKLLVRVIQPKMGHVRSVTYHALEWSIIHRGLS